MTSLKDMIGQDAWKKLNKKYDHLDVLTYHALCETCGKTFYETQLSTVQELLKSGEWDPHVPSYLWYVAAARHWLDANFHAVRVYVESPDGDKTLVKDLSADWSSQVPQQKAMLKKGIDFKQACHEELNRLEQSILAKGKS